MNPSRQLPSDELVRCAEWPRLASEARSGDAAARDRLKAHMEATQESVRTKIVHVSEVLAGGTCVPDHRAVVFYQNDWAVEETGLYYLRCDGSYRDNEGRLRPPRIRKAVRAGFKDFARRGAR